MAGLDHAAHACLLYTSDPRVTRVGRFLRRTSLDELPQLINVWKGDMSLVGPRPFVVEEAAGIEGWARKRFEARPGMTGLWQVSGRNELSHLEPVSYTHLGRTVDVDGVLGEMAGHWDDAMRVLESRYGS